MATTTEIPVTLNKDEILRYSRHLIMPEVGMEGQQKLKAARVLCIGTGGLGSPLALYLAAAGVGTLGLVDFDVVDYHEPAAADHSFDGRRGPQETRFRGGQAEGDQSVSESADLRHAAEQRERAGTVSRVRHHRRRHRQFSHALSGE